MKRCPKCDTQYADEYLFCGKCGMKLEPIPEQSGGIPRRSRIDLRKKEKSPRPETTVSPVDPLLESAKASYEAGRFSECVRQLEDAIESGVPGARCMYGCFLDDSEDFRLAVERHHYSEVIPSSFVSSSSSPRATQTSSRSGGAVSSASGSDVERTTSQLSRSGSAVSSTSDPEAVFQEGIAAYKRGRYESAVRSFRDAVEGDHAKAKFWLGLCYETGRGVRQDQAKADKWYRQAVMQFRESAQDDADALYCLAICCEEGKGVEKNEVEAVKWYIKAVKQYRLAAEQGDTEAEYMLGCCYEAGKGVD